MPCYDFIAKGCKESGGSVVAIRFDSSIFLAFKVGSVPNSKSRNIPEVVIVRRGAGGVLGIWEGWVNWVKGGANQRH